jgi:hypothetical protein
MKTLKAEAVYLTEYDSYGEVAADLSRFIEEVYNATRLHSASGYLSPINVENHVILSNDRGTLQSTVAPGGRTRGAAGQLFVETICDSDQSGDCGHEQRRERQPTG